MTRAAALRAACIHFIVVAFVLLLLSLSGCDRCDATGVAVFAGIILAALFGLPLLAALYLWWLSMLDKWL